MAKVQTRFRTDVEEPWKGICCEACWTAHGDKCTCRCGGLYHGLGLKEKGGIPGEVALLGEAADKILGLIKNKRCRWCGAELEGPVYGYPHDAGWEVEGEKEKLWLYIHCQKCGYDWALWKLGISREATF